MRARAEAIEGFAEVLRELRTSVGNPSFREMSGRSGAISHTTLHEATKGNRLPSWGTTAEFVKACGGDPEAYRERWEQANLVVRGASTPPPRPADEVGAPVGGAPVGDTSEAQSFPVTVGSSGGDPAASATAPPRPPGTASPQTSAPGQPPADASASIPAVPQPSHPATASAPVPAQSPGTPSGTMPSGTMAPLPLPHPPGGGPPQQPLPPHPHAGFEGGIQQVGAPSRPRKRIRPIHLAAAVIAAAGVGAVVYVMTMGDGDPKSHAPVQSPSDRSSSAAVAAGCPVKPSQPAWAPPLHKGDAAAFVDDVTLRDCTVVGPGQTVIKVWRIRNTGALYWRGYSLRRLDLPQTADDCRTKNRVPIKYTRPGDTVDIRVEVTTPKKPAFCYVRFKMLDSDGRVAFTGNRPVNFQLVVREH
ncbi:NBR1-Ig-like domain-containing protein [Spirillospora sp. NPDC049652]